MKDQKAFKPDISEPTKEDIKKAIATVKRKNGVILNHKDGASFAKLIAELRWWLDIEKEAQKPDAFDKKFIRGIAKEVKSQPDKKLSAKNSPERMKLHLDYAIGVYKKKILKEMKAILDKY
ncbi:MAG: hypothetical protein BWY19_00297 [bacterium ADurb.Bin212]|nr:MAG: hypothetical protein BWY19_00297 [bacterium ADurb.Bin212]